MGGLHVGGHEYHDGEPIAVYDQMLRLGAMGALNMKTTGTYYTDRDLWQDMHTKQSG